MEMLSGVAREKGLSDEELGAIQSIVMQPLAYPPFREAIPKSTTTAISEIRLERFLERF